MNGCIENDRASIGFRTALLANAGAAMSALPPEADIRQRIEHVCFVPKANSDTLYTVLYTTAHFFILTPSPPSRSSPASRNNTPFLLNAFWIFDSVEPRASVTPRSMPLMVISLAPEAWARSNCLHAPMKQPYRLNGWQREERELRRLMGG